MTAKHTVVVTCGGVASAIAYALLAWKSRQPGLVPLSTFFACLGVAVACSLLVYWRLHGVPLTRATVRQLILWAVLFRAIGFFGAPLYEDDFYRYLWDGRAFAVTGNPYDHAPGDSFGDDNLSEKFQNILSRINYPEVRTIYGPVCQVAFLAAYAIAPGEVWPLKLIFIAADLCIVWLLWLLVGNSAALILYAWSPLVLKEVAFTAHTDVLAAMFLVIGFVLSKRLKAAAAGLNLALAVAAKVVAFLPVPFLLWKRRWLGIATFAIACAALYLPFLARGTSEMGGLSTFASEWEFNSFGFAVLKSGLGAAAARSAWLLLFAAFYAFYFAKRQNEPNLTVVFGVFFLLAPVVNPWYLLLMAPFVVIQPAAWSILALQTVLLSYITAGNLGIGGSSLFEHPWWVRPLEIIPVAIGLGWHWKTSRKASNSSLNLLAVESKGATP